MISSRIAKSDELDLVRSIRERGFVSVREIYTPNQDAIPVASHDLKAPNDGGVRYDILADIDGLAAGVVSVVVDGNILRLSGLAVLPELRRQGFAKSLLKHAERLAVDAGCQSIELFTVRETGNVAIFNRLGFHVVDETVADWCWSNRFKVLLETEMEKRFG